MCILGCLVSGLLIGIWGFYLASIKEPVTVKAAVDYGAEAAESSSGASIDGFKHDAPARRTKAGSGERAETAPQVREGPDAANLYAAAFGLFDSLSEQEKAILSSPREEVDAAHAQALFDKIQPIMTLLQRAAEADYCDWGIVVAFAGPLPHIEKGAHLGKLALWNAAYRFPEEPDAALRDLAARNALGGHLGDNVFGLMVGASFERSAAALIHEHSAWLSPATVSQADHMLASSTLATNVARAFEAEMKYVHSFAEHLLEQSPIERVRVLNAMAEEAGRLQSLEMRALQASLGASGDGEGRIRSELQYLQQVESQLGEAILWPEATFQQWWKEVQNAAEASYPLLNSFLPDLAKARSSLQRVHVEQTMLRAGLSVMQNGPWEIGTFLDPASGSAFRYVPTPAGFELRSALSYNGNSVSMNFVHGSQ